MSEYQFINRPNIIKFIQELEGPIVDVQCMVAGWLFINELSDAGMELLDLTEHKYVDYLLKYIYP